MSVKTIQVTYFISWAKKLPYAEELLFIEKIKEKINDYYFIR